MVLDALFGTLVDLPGSRVIAVDHRWNGPAVPAGKSKGHRQRMVMSALVGRLVAHGLTIGAATVDDGSQLKHYRTGFNAAASSAPPGAVRADLASTPSERDLRIQLADLIAFAAFHAASDPSTTTRALPGLARGFHDSVEPRLIRDGEEPLHRL